MISFTVELTPIFYPLVLIILIAIVVLIILIIRRIFSRLTRRFKNRDNKAAKSPWLKGIVGEGSVNRTIQLSLDKKKYHLLKNVTLPTKNGTTQIDHIIVSQYGIFVIETKNMAGWIFGKPHDKIWTQKIFKYSNKFQNPLHQNYKHVKTLESLLNIKEGYIFSVVVFIGKSTFKTDMPDNVTHAKSYIQYIKSKKQAILSISQARKMIKKIKSSQLKPSPKTDKAHIKHVESIIKTKKNKQSCPKCGKEMVIRTAKKGINIGRSFWGCTHFPKCRGTINIT